MYKKIILIIILVLFSINVFADHLNLKYDYFMAVNTSNKINIYNGFNGSEKIYFIIEDMYSLLNYDNSTSSYGLYVSSNIEEDVDFRVQESSTDSELKTGGFSTGPITGNYVIDSLRGNEDYFFLFSDVYITKNGSSEHISTVCANMRVETIPRNVKFVTGIYNGSNYEYYESSEVLMDNTDYEIICEDINVGIHNHTENLNITSGFYCTDCDVNGLILATDTNTSYLGKSSTFNGTDLVQITTLNFRLAMLLEENLLSFDIYEGTLRFRIPYNITINLYQENASGLGVTTQYCNEFSEIFMTYIDDKDIFKSINNYPIYFNKFMQKLPFIGDDLTFLKTDFETDDALFFTGNYENCKSEITLYETGNYSLFLLGSKIKTTNPTYDFNNPVTGEEQFISNIVDLEFLEKQNLELNIFTSDWEISKIWVILNLLKYVFTFVLPIVLIYLVRTGAIEYLLSRWFK